MKHWTAAQTEIARQMVASDATDSEFHQRLGRTRRAATSHLDRLRYGHNTKSNRVMSTPTAGRVKIPESVMAEAQRRLTAPRSITAMVCGDPEFFQSALGKKLGASA